MLLDNTGWQTLESEAVPFLVFIHYASTDCKGIYKDTAWKVSYEIDVECYRYRHRSKTKERQEKLGHIHSPAYQIFNLYLTSSELCPVVYPGMKMHSLLSCIGSYNGSIR